MHFVILLNKNDVVFGSDAVLAQILTKWPKIINECDDVIKMKWTFVND